MQYNVDNNLNASTIIFGEGSLLASKNLKKKKKENEKRKRKKN